MLNVGLSIVEIWICCLCWLWAIKALISWRTHAWRLGIELEFWLFEISEFVVCADYGNEFRYWCLFWLWRIDSCSETSLDAGIYGAQRIACVLIDCLKILSLLSVLIVGTSSDTFVYSDYGGVSLENWKLEDWKIGHCRIMNLLSLLVMSD